MKQSSLSQTLRMIIVSFLIGGTAGVLGTALTTNYFSTYTLQLGELTEPLRIAQERPRAIPETYKDALDRIQDRSLPATGTIFLDDQLQNELTSVFDNVGPVGALTSDGWGISMQGNVGDVVRWGTQTCRIDRVISEPLYGVKFVHCDIGSVPVLDIGSGYDLDVGSQVFAVSSDQNFVFTQVQAIQWGAIERSSDVPTRRVYVKEELPSGTLLFNVYGEFVGMTVLSNDEIVMVPFEHVSGAFKQVLADVSSVAYPSLGVMGIDLARQVQTEGDYAELHAGVLITEISPPSSAEYVQLQEGDIILSVDGVAVNGTYSLDDLIIEKTVGEEVYVLINRGGQEQELLVALGERTF